MVELAAADTIGKRAGLWRDRDPELPAQPLREPLVQSDRARAVGDREPHHQITMGGLVERIERHPLAAVANRLLKITGRRGRIRKRRQRLAATFAIRVACRQRPVIVKTDQQIATAQRERLLVLSGGDQGVERARVDPRFRLAGQTDRLAASDQGAVRGRAESATDTR